MTIAELIVLFGVLATVLRKLSQLTVLHLEWGVLQVEFRDSDRKTWVKQESPKEFK
jgi:hypothetical protein